MRGDPDAFAGEVRSFLKTAGKRKRRSTDVRLGYIGIPPIMSGIHDYVECQGGLVVFNELQRQFSMPQMRDDIVDQYLVYTYPYHIKFRLADIKTEIARRKIDGVIHYVQAFCFRQIEDIIVRKALGVPVLTIEGNRPGRIDLRTQIRIEAFLDMLRSLKD
jgi:benzoyl-CoA reductase/2-hydroxyglutaryl-CoA dehydratase subunit BcrC/BadD/HgdB